MFSNRNFVKNIGDRNSSNGNIETNEFQYSSCKKGTFNTCRGMNQDLRQCIMKIRSDNLLQSTQPVTESEREIININFTLSKFKWCKNDGNELTIEINDAYQKLVFMIKNLFLMPSGSAGIKYVNEVTRLINAWTYYFPMNSIALKAIHVMPSLLLQKPSSAPKSKDHIKA